MDVSVIIVNYHTSALVMQCIASVVQWTQSTYEVIVVDNATEPELGAALTERFGDKVVFVSLPENVGFGRANNAGLEVAQGRHILFLNPDTLLLNPAIDCLCDYLDQHPHTGAVGGNLYDGDRRPTHSYMRLFPSLRLECVRLLGSLLLGRDAHFNYSGQVKRVAYITGADLMMPRRVLDAIGGYDPAFFMYYEETDLCKRVWQAHYVVESVPQAEIMHLEGASFSTNERRESMRATSRDVYYRKHLSTFERFFAIFVGRINAVLRWCVFALLGKKEQRACWRVKLKYA